MLGQGLLPDPTPGSAMPSGRNAIVQHPIWLCMRTAMPEAALGRPAGLDGVALTGVAFEGVALRGVVDMLLAWLRSDSSAHSSSCCWGGKACRACTA